MALYVANPITFRFVCDSVGNLFSVQRVPALAWIATSNKAFLIVDLFSETMILVKGLIQGFRHSKITEFTVLLRHPLLALVDSLTTVGALGHW